MITYNENNKVEVGVNLLYFDYNTEGLTITNLTDCYINDDFKIPSFLNKLDKIPFLSDFKEEVLESINDKQKTLYGCINKYKFFRIKRRVDGKYHKIKSYITPEYNIWSLQASYIGYKDNAEEDERTLKSFKLKHMEFYLNFLKETKVLFPKVGYAFNKTLLKSNVDDLIFQCEKMIENTDMDYIQKSLRKVSFRKPTVIITKFFDELDNFTISSLHENIFNCYLEKIILGYDKTPKCINVPQPWAWAMTHLPDSISKDFIGLNVRNLNYKGDCYVYANKKFDKKGFNFISDLFKEQGINLRVPSKHEFRYNQVVGKVNITDMIDYKVDSIWKNSEKDNCRNYIMFDNPQIIHHNMGVKLRNVKFYNLYI